MPTEKKIVIFDLDGVLINSLKNMEIAWSSVSEKFNLNIKFGDYKKYIGLPFEIILRKLKITKNLVQIKNSYNFYSKKNFKKIKIYPGVKDVFKYLKKKNYITAVITSKDKERTKKIISLFKLKFKYIYSPTKLIRPKPYPDQILKIIKLEKIKKKNCYYVGDMNVDFKFAKNAKINFIFINYGYENKKVNSKIKIKNFRELKKIL